MSTIRYKNGYKYQLYDEHRLFIDIHPVEDIELSFIGLSTEGELVIRKGYAWDGPSGPAMDTPTFMRGSLVHDALYELMRYDMLDRATCKAKADRIMKDLCIEDGMSPLRAWWAHKGVDWFGGRATKRQRRIFEAP